MRGRVSQDVRRRAKAELFYSNRKLGQISKKLGLPARFAIVSGDKSFIKVRHRCFLSGRPRRARKRYNLARQRLRSLAFKAQVSGLRRASWLTAFIFSFFRE